MRLRNVTSFLLVSIVTGLVLPVSGSSKSRDLAEALFSNPLFLETKLSPDGLHMASLSYYKEKLSLYILNLNTKVYEIVTVNEGEDIGPFFWVDNEHIVYNVNKWELYSMGLNVHSITKDRSWKILNPWETKLYFAGMVDPLTHMKGKFVFKATPKGPADLYMIDIGNENLVKLADNTGAITDYIVNEEGIPVHAVESRGGDAFIVDWDKDSGWASTGINMGKCTPLGMLPGGKFLLTETVNEQGFRGINLFDLQGKQFAGQPRYLDGYDLCKNPIIDNLSGKIIGVRYEREKPGNFWFDSAVRTVEQAIKVRFSDYCLNYVGYNPVSRTSYFSASSDTMAPVLIQLDDGSATPSLIYQQLPKTFAMEFQVTEPYSFQSGDGTREIHGYLTKPGGEGPYPTILFVHGGPYNRDSWDFDPVVQYFALNGYAVLQVNYRGSTGYGYAYKLNNLGEVALLGVDDVIAGARHAIDQDVADPNRITVVGEGFGGLLATAAAAKAPDLWRSVVSFAAPYDLNALKIQDDKKNVDWMKDIYSGHDEALYDTVSPINHVQEITSPVLLVHGKSDKRVDPDQARDMEDALKRAGKQVDALYMNWGVHGLPEEQDRIEFFEEVLSFIKQH